MIEILIAIRYRLIVACKKLLKLLEVLFFSCPYVPCHVFEFFFFLFDTFNIVLCCLSEDMFSDPNFVWISITKLMLNIAYVKLFVQPGVVLNCVKVI